MEVVEYEIRSLNNSFELQKLIQVFEKTFEAKSQEKLSLAHLKKINEKDYFFGIVALLSQEIIGGATLYLMPSYTSIKAMAYLYDLAVLPHHQGKGIGKKIIEYAKIQCMKKGAQELFLHTDQKDDILQFYRSTQPNKEEKSMIFSYQFSHK